MDRRTLLANYCYRPLTPLLLIIMRLLFTTRVVYRHRKNNAFGSAAFLYCMRTIFNIPLRASIAMFRRPRLYSEKWFAHDRFTAFILTGKRETIRSTSKLKVRPKAQRSNRSRIGFTSNWTQHRFQRPVDFSHDFSQKHFPSLQQQ